MVGAGGARCRERAEGHLSDVAIVAVGHSAVDNPMPWTLDRPPASMRHLPLPVLAKAVGIANALLAQGHDEG
jgi:hypothetical protein